METRAKTHFDLFRVLCRAKLDEHYHTALGWYARQPHLRPVLSVFGRPSMATADANALLYALTRAHNIEDVRKAWSRRWWPRQEVNVELFDYFNKLATYLLPLSKSQSSKHPWVSCTTFDILRRLCSFAAQYLDDDHTPTRHIFNNINKYPTVQAVLSAINPYNDTFSLQLLHTNLLFARGIFHYFINHQ